MLKTLSKSTEQYWDKQYSKRIVSDHEVVVNADKSRTIINELAKRPYYAREKMLEIGCGLAFNAHKMTKIYPGWKRNWMGIDQSKTAVDWINDGVLKAVHGDIYKFKSKERFGVFLILDVFEHIEDEDRLAEVIREHGSENGYFIFGNCPRYESKHDREEGYERDVDSNIVKKFLKKCDCPYMRTKAFWSKGLPYFWWEGFSSKVVF